MPELASTSPEPLPGPHRPNPKLLLVLVALALLTRLAWVLWIHPPEDFVFSDMKRYVVRAQELVDLGFRPGTRSLAWQAWGTHTLLAIPLKLFGIHTLRAASVMWGLMGAAAVPLGYLLACRVCRHPKVPAVVGIVLLLWHPNISNSGYFLSETPFLCFQLWSTLWLVTVLQEGRRALGAGIVSAVAFAVRPQSALFFVFVLATWWLVRKRVPHVRVRHLVAIAMPLLLVLGFSMWRFHAHTGYWGGIAENGNMNLTAGRCHNIVTQAFADEASLRRSERADNTKDGRRVSLPGFRVLAKRFEPEHPFALRPAFGEETIRFVGYIGDPVAHAEIRRQCYERTGVLGQIRYSLVNASLLWFFGHQWPEMDRMGRPFVPYVEFYKYVFQILVWLPALIGTGLALARLRSNPGLSFCAWQQVTSIAVAATFFGDIRLRTPYDPYAIILAAEIWAVLLAKLRARRSRPGPATPPAD